MTIKKSTNSTPKLISDSAFRAHLSLCKNWETINLSDLKLKTHTSNSGSWRCYAGGEKRNENKDLIKCGKRMGGKLDGPIQCFIMQKFHPTTCPLIFCSQFGVSQKKFMSPSNVERGHAPSAVGDLFNNIESVRKQHANA